MALSTYKTYLLYNSGTPSVPVWNKLIDIKSVPAIGTTRDTQDVTRITDWHSRTFKGLEQLGSLSFTCNFDANVYRMVRLFDEQNDIIEFVVCKGDYAARDGYRYPFGADGAWYIAGQVSVGINEGSVDNAFEMTITIYPQMINNYNHTAIE